MVIKSSQLSTRSSILFSPQPLISFITIACFLQTHTSQCEEQQKSEPSTPFTQEYDTVESNAIERQKHKDLETLSIGQVNQFHLRLVETLGETLPKNVEVKYIGPLATLGARPSVKIHSQGIVNGLSWSVEDTVRIFTFWVSTTRTASTVAVTKAGKRTIYLNLSHIDNNQSPDTLLISLGGRSVREILKLLEKQPISSEPELKCIKDLPREPKAGKQTP